VENYSGLLGVGNVKTSVFCWTMITIMTAAKTGEEGFVAFK
jgi:hypothetical protein